MSAVGLVALTASPASAITRPPVHPTVTHAQPTVTHPRPTVTHPKPSATSAAPALAGADCDATVGDAALVLGDEPAALAARVSLPDFTMLRVRTVTSVPGGDLDAYEKVLQARCHWIDATAKRLPSLLVVMVSTTDRRMGIYVGSALSGTITKPVWTAIEQDVMRPYFARAAWTDGLLAGLKELDRDLAPPAAPAVALAPPASPSGSSPFQYDANGNLIQGDGSAEHPYVSDPDGLIPGSSGNASGSSVSSSGNGPIIGLVALGAVGAVIAGAFALARGGSGRSRRRWDPTTSTWITDGSPGSYHHGGHHGGSGFGGGSSFGGGDSSGGGGGGGDGGGSSGF